ncbi:tetratricopeptide repeat protein [Desmospora profundinema]|uniref:Tetratricopeptide (TPR) repeat protein n=1 Tax=Desmospora profundinema TaxID=1571184 RepID=A0ABU1IJ74_9BACL|nr:tetratricopeptide repeat protein [Desmospora profundinema]MDR6224448.1 tetratricopeptide (TPR) repeat protein [Desmospora profundinema]
MLQEWLKHYSARIAFIQSEYPTAQPPERSRMRQEVQGIRNGMGELLEGWIALEEAMAALLQTHPDLDGNEQEEVGEEFWLDGQVVRAFRQGQGYYQLKMFQEARPFFDQVVESEPEFLLGRVYLALSQFQSGQWSEAQRHFQLVAETAEHARFQAFAHHMLGCVHIKRGGDEQAIRHFEKALAIDPDHGDSWFNLGACYYRLQEYHEAVPRFFHALRTGERDWEAMYYLACCYERAGRWESAAYWRMAAFEEIKRPEMMEEIARDFEASGDGEGAVRWYRKLLQQDPKRVAGYHGISWHLWQHGQLGEALAMLKKALTLAPRNPDLLFTFVWFQLQEGEEGEMDGIRRVMNQLPAPLADEPLWLILRSRLHARANEWNEAKELAHQVIQQAHTDPFTCSLGHYQMGRILLQQKNPSEARNHFRDAAVMAPDWREPLFFEGLCHWMEGNPDATRRCWESLPLAEQPHSL